jgi:cAMP-dependent protein kinase regulator
MAVLRVEIPFDDVADDQVEIEVIDPARVALLRTPIFAKLPPASLEKLIGRLDLRLLGANEEVFREGDAGATLYVIAEGDVSVDSHGNQLATLGPGAFFGEIALVTDLPRSATVRAVGRVELLAIDREVVREAAAEQPEIIGVLLGFVRDRLVDRITRTSALFQPFTEDERGELAGRFELVEVDAGAQLITQGERADGLYIVLAGRVDVTRTGEPAAIATLGSGDVFGEISLMSAKGSTANVRAVTRVLALRLPATIFHEIIMTYPQVLAYLGELSASRSRLQQAEDILDLHIDLI